MMKFTKTEKLLLFAFGCSDRAETFCRLGAASGGGAVRAVHRTVRSIAADAVIIKALPTGREAAHAATDEI